MRAKVGRAATEIDRSAKSSCDIHVVKRVNYDACRLLISGVAETVTPQVRWALTGKVAIGWT